MTWSNFCLRLLNPLFSALHTYNSVYFSYQSLKPFEKVPQLPFYETNFVTAQTVTEITKIRKRPNKVLPICYVRKTHFSATKSKCILRRIWGSHSNDYKDYRLLGYDTVKFGKQVPTFWRNLLLPSSVKKMETADSSKTLVSLCQNTRRHILKHNNLQILRTPYIGWRFSRSGTRVLE
jgi:hypothetical protein